MTSGVVNGDLIREGSNFINLLNLNVLRKFRKSGKIEKIGSRSSFISSNGLIVLIYTSEICPLTVQIGFLFQLIEDIAFLNQILLVEITTENYNPIGGESCLLHRLSLQLLCLIFSGYAWLKSFPKTKFASFNLFQSLKNGI